MLRRIALLATMILVLGTPAVAQEWVCYWNHEGFFYGVQADGTVGYFSHIHPNGTYREVGTFGDGPWVDFARGFDGPMYALKRNGEVWAMPFNSTGSTWLHATLPAELEWCAFEAGNDHGPGYALSCDGQLWAFSEPPSFVASFPTVVSNEKSSFGASKAMYR